jgi:hypothetical protein
MIKPDVIPNLARMAPPESIDAAAAVIANYGGSGAESFYGLIGCLFLNLDHFVKGMNECRWNIRTDELCNNGTIVTYKADAIGQDGCEWRFILNQVGPYKLEVVNAKLKRTGELTADAVQVVKDIKETLEG